MDGQVADEILEGAEIAGIELFGFFRDPERIRQVD